ncbi:ABC transporter ATP-binding protein [Mycoplasmopsis hyopharyngis]|uniref:ABC transporter ATP-binding protein n=1 Tax=Mycoplasmopsis hyopharyngis TaxID=29558 RepID=UPI0038730345
MIKMLPIKNKLLFLLGAFVISLTVFVSLFMSNVIGQFIKLIISDKSQNIDINFFSGRLIFKDIDYGIAKRNLILSFAGLTIFNALAILTATVLIVYTAELSSKFYRDTLFAKIQNLSLKNIADLKAESIITRVSNDVAEFWDFLVNGTTAMIKAPVMVIGGAILAFLTDKKMSIGVWLIIPLIIIIILSIGLAASPSIKKNQKVIEEVTKNVNENILGARVIKTFNLQANRKEKFHIANRNWYRLQYKINIIFAIGNPLFFSLINLLIAVVYWVVARQITTKPYDLTANKELIVNINVFLDYLFIVSFGVILMSMFLVSLFRAKISAQRITEILDYDIKLLERKNDKHISNYDLNVKELSFKYYDSSPDYSLLNINFTLGQNKVLGIIGPTGSGKSTLANLLVNNYIYNEGSIKIGENEVNEIDSQNLNKSIGIVYQEALLYTGTIKSNMLFAKDDASDEEIIEALKNACAYEFVNNFQDGLEHKVKQGGKNLSGGQKQRLSIARTLLRKPKIIILDDSTSALDNLTANKLINNIKQNYNCSLIIISQKISAIKSADNILVLARGSVMAQGSHKELVNECTLYREIFNNQLDQ